MRLPVIDKTKYEEVDEVIYNIGSVEKREYPTGYEEDSKVKYIKSIERIVRNSEEYREYIKFLKDELDMDRCLILNGLSVDDVSIEIHHSFLTLFDLVEIVLNKYEALQEEITPFKIADEVTHLHYKGLVMLTPLTLTIHQLVHNGDIFIPIQLQEGNYLQFYEEYKKYIPKEMEQRMRDYIELSNEFTEDIQYPILSRKFTFLNIDGVSLPRPITKEDKGDEE